MRVGPLRGGGTRWVGGAGCLGAPEGSTGDGRAGLTATPGATSFEGVAQEAPGAGASKSHAAVGPKGSGRKEVGNGDVEDDGEGGDVVVVHGTATGLDAGEDVAGHVDVAALEPSDQVVLGPAALDAQTDNGGTDEVDGVTHGWGRQTCWVGVGQGTGVADAGAQGTARRNGSASGAACWATAGKSPRVDSQTSPPRCGGRALKLRAPARVAGGRQCTGAGFQVSVEPIQNGRGIEPWRRSLRGYHQDDVNDRTGLRDRRFSPGQHEADEDERSDDEGEVEEMPVLVEKGVEGVGEVHGLRQLARRPDNASSGRNLTNFLSVPCIFFRTVGAGRQPMPARARQVVPALQTRTEGGVLVCSPLTRSTVRWVWRARRAMTASRWSSGRSLTRRS